MNSRKRLRPCGGCRIHRNRSGTAPRQRLLLLHVLPSAASALLSIPSSITLAALSKVSKDSRTLQKLPQMDPDRARMYLKAPNFNATTHSHAHHDVSPPHRPPRSALRPPLELRCSGGAGSAVHDRDGPQEGPQGGRCVEQPRSAQGLGPFGGFSCTFRGAEVLSDERKVAKWCLTKWGMGLDAPGVAGLHPR
eukprot:scaffold385_cov305-Pinguiococcus_pyrenoidosus.AAC.19